MPLSSALRFFGVWSGSMALAESRPVAVCLQTIYGLNSGVFLSTLLHCLILTRAWFGALSRVCLHAYLPRLLLIFLPPQDMCICMLFISPSPKYGLFFPPEGMRIAIRMRPESPCTCFYIRSSLDEYLSTDSSV